MIYYIYITRIAVFLHLYNSFVIYSKEIFFISLKLADLSDIKNRFAVYVTKSQFDHIKSGFLVIKNQHFSYISQTI